jgi:RNA polymerase sigma-70 factor (ECF subfamily)
MRFNSYLLAMFVSVRIAAAAVTAPHAEVRSEGLTDAQSTAIASTISAAHKAYVEDFSFEMPDKVIATITAKANQPTRLFTDGNDRLTLSLPAANKLDRPEKSGVFNLYGICHELGHIAMYRTLKNREWLTGAGAEGWAHYTGSYVVDRVFEAQGEKLWADPYDYRRDGMARLKKQLESPAADPTTKAAGQWQELEKIIGRKEFPKLFSAWQSAQVDLANPAPALSKALFELKPDQRAALEKWWQAASPILIEKREASEFKAATIAANKLSGKPVEIVLDDNTEEGKSSLAGGAHARTFAAPGAGEWYLTRIEFKAARYGPGQAPPTQFDIALCDKDNKPIATWKKPYAMVPRAAQLDWIKIEIPPTRVPADFMINLSFNPTASSGIFVAYDSSTSGKSHTSKPGSEGRDFAKGDWMIRPHLDRPKDADALK